MFQAILSRDEYIIKKNFNICFIINNMCASMANLHFVWLYINLQVNSNRTAALLQTNLYFMWNNARFNVEKFR